LEFTPFVSLNIARAEIKALAKPGAAVVRTLITEKGMTTIKPEQPDVHWTRMNSEERDGRHEEARTPDLYRVNVVCGCGLAGECREFEGDATEGFSDRGWCPRSRGRWRLRLFAMLNVGVLAFPATRTETLIS
jgi:hypothetical protein